MDKYQPKSILIGRKKGSDDEPDVRPCFINLFNENNPHKSGEAPFEVLDFDKVHKIVIKGLDVNYLLPGNDLVINDIEFVHVDANGLHITITGKHLKK